MLTKFIEFFAHRLLLVNFVFIAVVLGGIYYWQAVNTEEYPSIEFDFVRVSTSYPGASAEDVEYFVTRPIENALRSVNGIYSLRSTSTSGSSSIFVEIEKDATDKRTVVDDIETAVLSVNLPTEVRERPNVRQFKTSQRSVIDIALIDKEARVLDFTSRSRLQTVALALENQLLSLGVVSSVSRSGYQKKQIRINLLPEKLTSYDLSIASVAGKLANYDLKQPLGKLQNVEESEVVVADTVYDVEELENFILRGNYLAPEVRLKDIARVENSFASTKTISKVNGHEAIILRVAKSSSAGIVKAIDQIKATVANFSTGQEVAVVLLDDESIDIRNRISLIMNNGMIGFVLILLLLFLLLDFNSGFWVAMSIPFCFAFTMIVAYFLGYTINNVTLSGVIIVMGMLVDDAIVVAENIVRLRRKGVPFHEAAVQGTREMFLPVTAAIITTCIAFIPLFIMEGRFSALIFYIPAVVVIMLGASLFESLFLLPAHMVHDVSKSFLVRMLKRFGALLVRVISFNRIKSGSISPNSNNSNNNWFDKVEDRYAGFLTKVIHYRLVAIMFFIAMISWSVYHFTQNMKFSMFPASDVTEVFISGSAPPGTVKNQTSRLLEQVESALDNTIVSGEVLSYRTDIGRMRRGQAAEENSYTILVEFSPKEQRVRTVDEVITQWNQSFDVATNLSVSVNKQRFGRGSGGTPIEVAVLDNNESRRNEVIKLIKTVMENDPALFSVEEDRQTINPGYAVKMNRGLANVVGVDEKKVLSSLRTVLNGQVLKEIPLNDEEVDLTLTLPDEAKTNISQLLNIPIDIGANTFKVAQFVQFEPDKILSTISRERYRRIGKLYADNEDNQQSPKARPGKKPGSTNENKEKLPVKKATAAGGSAESIPVSTHSGNNRKTKPSLTLVENLLGENGAQAVEATLAKAAPGQTALEIATRYEQTLFPAISAKYPSSIVYFDGEVKESRESQSGFVYGLYAVVFLIFMVLALLFNSLFKPLIVMSILPFATVGVALAFFAHGIDMYGFFALMGFLGLIGVVVNDTIVMVVRLSEMRFTYKLTSEEIARNVAEIAKTRLRAVIMTTLTTVAGLFPTVYGIAGYDSMLTEMMFVMAWGLTFATVITLMLVPILYSFYLSIIMRKRIG